YKSTNFLVKIQMTYAGSQIDDIIINNQWQPLLSTPVNLATNQPKFSTFTWQPQNPESTWTYHLNIYQPNVGNIFDDTTITGTSFTVTNPLPFGATLQWKVRAKSDDGRWTPFSPINTMGVVAGPPAQTTLKLPVDNSANEPRSMVISWNRTARAAEYTVQVSTQSNFGTFVVNQANYLDSSFALSGLTYNTTYYWRVKGLNSEGDSGFSAVRQFTTRLARVDSLRSTAIASSQINLKWNAVTGALGYKLYRSATDSAATLVKRDSIGAVTAYADTGLVGGQQYFYRIAAVKAGNNLGDTSYAFTTSTIPAMPTNLVTTEIGDTSITLKWKSGGGTFSKYRLYRKTGAGAYSIAKDSIAKNDTLYQDKTVLPNTSYTYRLVTSGATGVISDTITEIQKTTLKAIPRIVSLQPLNAGIKTGTVKFLYTLQMLATDSVTLNGYFSTNSGTDYLQTGALSGKRTGITGSLSDTLIWNSSADLNGQELATVKFKVIPVGVAGGSRDTVPYSIATANMGIDNKMPVFTGVNAVVPDSNRVTVRWSAATDKSNPVQYRVFKSFTSNGFNYNAPDTTVSDTSAVIKGLLNFKEYYFAVRAVDGVGNVDTNSVVKSGIPAIKPSAVITSPFAGALTKQFKIGYSVSVAATDTVRLTYLYSVNGGTSYDTIKNYSGGKSEYVTSSSDTITWNSLAAYTGETSSARLKIVPTGRGGAGKEFTASLTLDNKS
ncbi:MAG: fibronectin type III domain-containing protein, partial [Bacteroidota bacterium]